MRDIFEPVGNLAEILGITDREHVRKHIQVILRDGTIYEMPGTERLREGEEVQVWETLIEGDEGRIHRPGGLVGTAVCVQAGCNILTMADEDNRCTECGKGFFCSGHREYEKNVLDDGEVMLRRTSQ